MTLALCAAGVVERRELEFLDWPMCSFGAAYRKDTRLYFANFDSLRALSVTCNRNHAHASLSGGHCTAAAASYPPQPQVCAASASIINSECRGAVPANTFPPVEVSPDPRAVESPLLNVILRSLNFQVVHQ